MTRDLRRYSQQTSLRLLVGFLLLVFIIGDGLVYLLWGSNAAIAGMACQVLGLVPVVAIWLLLAVIDWLIKRDRWL